MESYFVDTNFYLRILLNDVPSQAKIASDYLDKAKVGKVELIFQTEVLIEMTHVLRVRYEVERERIAQILLDLVNTPYITLPDRNVMLHVAVLYGRTKLDTVDLVLKVRAEQEGKKVLSFDKELSGWVNS